MLICKNNLRRGYNDYLEIDKEPQNMRLGIMKHVAGEFETIIPSNTEKVLLVLNGNVDFVINDKERIETMRKNVFQDFPKLLHVNKDTLVKVEFKSDGEVLLQEVNNDKLFDYVFYDENNVTVNFVGSEAGAMKSCQRFVIDIINDKNSPYSNLVFGETLVLPGNWTGFPAHHHPQPEVALYRFEKPEGYGMATVGEVIFQIRNNSLISVTPDKIHPAVTLPGYAMWSMWSLRHLPDNRFVQPEFAPEFKWAFDSHDEKFSHIYLRKEQYINKK